MERSSSSPPRTRFGRVTAVPSLKSWAPSIRAITPALGIGSIITGTLYGLVDGAIGGAIFGWLYNFLSGKFPSRAG